MSPVYVLRSLLVSRLTVLTLLLLSAGNANGHHDDCPDTFDCGNLGTIRYPFTKVERQDCGALAIHGCDDLNKTSVKHVQLDSRRKPFQVTKVENRRRRSSISIIDHDFSKLLQNGGSSCCRAFGYNVTLPPPSPFGYFYMERNITTFKCNLTHLKFSPANNFFKNSTCCPSNLNFYFGPSNYDDEDQRTSCSMLHLPVVEGFVLSANPFPYLTSEITFTFQSSAFCSQCFQDGGGHCRLDTKRKLFCPKRKGGISTRKLALMLGTGVGPWVIFGLFLTLRNCKRKHHGPGRVQLQSINICADDRDIESDRIFFGVPVFSYKELQEATNYFDHTKKLGDGGFGTVYYGKLRDGREVAIKHLFEHNYKRVEQFINEIEILTKLRHKNLVTLYGCTSRHSHELLLIYEYIPNGTVASHLHGNLSRVGVLTWPIRMQIAIDTATALAYLHASNIIHRDVKTNNILLDINFSVKVADFGLSRLLPNDVSHVSTAPQGSPGYLDPEYFQCYRLTDKSDVYSFGVVLMELISSMPPVDATRERDEINLANLAIKKIRKGKIGELVDPSLGFETDHEVRRMITSVAELGFQCVQGDKELRPSMDDVLEALRKIGSGKYDCDEEIKHGDGVGISPRDEVGKSLTEKWESASATPNVSG